MDKRDFHLLCIRVVNWFGLSSDFQSIEGPRENAVGRVLALHMADPDCMPGTLCAPPSLPRVILENPHQDLITARCPPPQ